MGNRETGNASDDRASGLAEQISREIIMKIAEIRKLKDNLYGILLDNGKMINLSIDVLPELDNTLTFTAVLPTGWIMTGGTGGIYGDYTDVNINPSIGSRAESLDGIHEIADSVRVSADYISATVDAVKEIMKTLE